MAVFNEPTKWQTSLVNSGDANVIPQSTPVGTGEASFDDGFPQITQIPIGAGGIAPDRKDFNGLFKILGDWIFFNQNGGVSSYSENFDYVAGRVVSYNDNLYKCIQANGVSSTVVTPDSNTAYWQRIDNFVRSVNGVEADAEGNVQTGFPSDTFVTIFENITNYGTLSDEAYINSYTAPANGYVACSGQRNPNTGASACYINTSKVGATFSSGTSVSALPGFWVGGTIPVKKGDVVNFLILNLQNTSARFTYAEGEI